MLPLRDLVDVQLKLLAQLGHGPVLAKGATRALNSALCVRRTRLATLAFFFNFMVKTPLRRACAQQFKMGRVSTYRAVQICRTTSIFKPGATGPGDPSG